MNTIVSILVLVIVIALVSRDMRDAKAFTRFIAMLAIGIVVGVGVSSVVSTGDTTKTNNVIISDKSTTPMYNVFSPFVAENDTTNMDYTGKELKKVELRDSTPNNNNIKTDYTTGNKFIDDS